jgi:hypothetical protein
MSEDRYTHPADGEDPRERDREFTDAEHQQELQRTRHVTNDEPPAGLQGTSADAPGTNPADRHAD